MRLAVWRVLALGILAAATVGVNAQFNPSVTSSSGKVAKTPPAPASSPAPGAVATPVPAPAPPAPAANVYFYREGIDPQGVGRKALIHVDGQAVVSLASGHFFLLQLQPGQHTFAGPDLQQTAPMNVQAGEEYYFKTTVDRSSAKKLVAIHNVFRIDLVNPQVGGYDVKRLKPQDAEPASKTKPTGTSY